MIKQKVIHIELIVVTVLLLIPFPGSVPPRPACPRDRAALVRKVLEKRWLPILDRVGAPLPLECPLHPMRDLFSLHENNKNHREPKWMCGYCGKAFHHEHQLDNHMSLRHGDDLNELEDSVCLADYCDIMRCEVLEQKTASTGLEEGGESKHTALDIWSQHPMTRTYRHFHDDAETSSVRGNIMKPLLWQPWRKSTPVKAQPPPVDVPYPPQREQNPPTGRDRKNINSRSSENEEEGESDTSTGPQVSEKEKEEPEEGEEGVKEAPIHPLHSWRDSCNEEHLSELRAKCQMLIQNCIAGLVLNLTIEEVRDVEGALQRSVCWYLTCERYWEAGSVEMLSFPWWLLCGAILLLTLGVSLAYYAVWGTNESNDSSLTSPTVPSYTPIPTGTSTYLHSTYPPLSTAPINSTVASSTGGSLHHFGGSHNLGVSSPSGGQYSPTPGYSSYSVMSGSSRRRKLWAQHNDSESECRDSGFNEDDAPTHALAPFDPLSSAMVPTPPMRARHSSADSRPSSSTGVAIPPDDSGRIEERQFNYASSFTPNYEQRRLRRNRYNYLDDYDSFSEMEADQMDSSSLSRERSDSFIYVAYPPELKKRFVQSDRR